MFTTPEIICDLFSFLDKDQIERTQLVNQFWNKVIIRHKDILPLRVFVKLDFRYKNSGQISISLYAKQIEGIDYKIEFDGTNLEKKLYGSSRYSQLTVDEVLTNLNDVIYGSITIYDCDSEDRLDNLLNLMKLVTTKTGGRFRGILGLYFGGRCGSKLDEIVGKGFLNTARYKIHPS